MFVYILLCAIMWDHIYFYICIHMENETRRNCQRRDNEHLHALKLYILFSKKFLTPTHNYSLHDQKRHSVTHIYLFTYTVINNYISHLIKILFSSHLLI